jgi:hypothetical protein
MSRPGCDHFVGELEKLIDYFRLEYKMTYSEVIGCLELVKADVIADAIAEM